MLPRSSTEGLSSGFLFLLSLGLSFPPGILLPSASFLVFAQLVLLDALGFLLEFCPPRLPLFLPDLLDFIDPLMEAPPPPLRFRFFQFSSTSGGSGVEVAPVAGLFRGVLSVSYTHLTLPTIYSV